MVSGVLVQFSRVHGWISLGVTVLYFVKFVFILIIIVLELYKGYTNEILKRFRHVVLYRIN